MGIEVVMLKAWPTSSITHISQSMWKCCLGQSAKSKIPYHLIILYIDNNHMEYLYNIWLLSSLWIYQNFEYIDCDIWVIEVYLACSEYTSREVYSGLCLFLTIVYSVFQRCPTRDEISFPVGQYIQQNRLQLFYHFSRLFKYQNVEIWWKFWNLMKFLKILKFIKFITFFENFEL
jgi:hypothetical protein